MTKLFMDLSWQQIKDYIGKNNTIILPFGAIEEHGPHMPVSVDTDIIKSIVKKVSDKTDIIVYPVVPFGICNSTAPFTGTFTCDFGPFKEFVKQIYKNLYEHGFRKIIITSGHLGGDHISAIEIAAKEFMQDRNDAKLYFIDPYSFLENAFCDGDGHAGDLETSIMLHLYSDKVNMEKAVDETTPREPYLISCGKPTKSGIFGYATKATTEKGKIAFEKMVKGFVEVVDEIK